jgi:hypothetical protein
MLQEKEIAQCFVLLVPIQVKTYQTTGRVLLLRNGESETLSYWWMPNVFVSWIYALFVAIDANFRLKRKIVSNNITDPSLSRGWAYFVEEAGYKEFLAEKIDVAQEVSH